MLGELGIERFEPTLVQPLRADGDVLMKTSTLSEGKQIVSHFLNDCVSKIVQSPAIVNLDAQEFEFDQPIEQFLEFLGLYLFRVNNLKHLRRKCAADRASDLQHHLARRRQRVDAAYHGAFDAR